MWDVEYTDEFERWWTELHLDEQSSIESGVRMLEKFGPMLSRPYADTVSGSQYTNMKELRIQHQGKPFRVFYAFDPRRCAILLIGGDKTGDDRFYDRMIPLADKLYDAYLQEIREEGLI
jgi:hypothetical protein